jgi:hypothetical protein
MHIHMYAHQGAMFICRIPECRKSTFLLYMDIKMYLIVHGHQNVDITNCPTLT